MSRSLLLLLVLLAAPAWAQEFEGLVLSQGAFGANNSSVVRVSGVFAPPSSSTLAGGRIYTQGAEIIGDHLYLTAGDSFSGTSRVDVLDLGTGALVGQITQNVQNPRYLAEVGTDKAYVTNQDYSGGASFVTPLDLATNTAGTPIPVEGTPEDVTTVSVGTATYAIVALGAFGGKDSLAVLDPATDTLTGYIDIECAARFVVGVSPSAWAVCTDTDEAVLVDPATRTVTRRIAFGFEIGDPNGIGQDAASMPGILTRRGLTRDGAFAAISSERGVIVLTSSDGDYRLVEIDDADTLPITALAASADGSGFILGRPDPDNPFGANGTVTLHRDDGTLVETFAAGVFPSYVATSPNGFGTTVETVDASGLGLALDGPNPAHTRTALALTLDRTADVRVELFDVLGRPVARLADGGFGAGTHRLSVDASGLAPGTYLVRAATEAGVVTLPLTVAR